MASLVGRLWGRAQGPTAYIGLALVLGQGTVYLATPVISRTYSPELVGEAGVFVALAGAVGAVGTLRFDQQIVGCNDDDLPPLVRTGLLSCAIMSVGAGLGWLLWRETPWWSGVLFCLTAFGLGVSPMAAQLSFRTWQFRGYGVSRFLNGFSQASVHVLCGALGLTSFGLLLGYGLGYLSGLAVMVKRLVETVMRRGTRSWATSSAMTQGLVASLATLANALAVASPLILLSALWSDSAAGQYTMAQRLALAPAGLAVSAISPIVAARVGEHLRKGQSSAAVVRAHLRSWSLLGAGVLVALAVVPSAVFIAVLGASWTEAVGMIRALAPMIAVLMVVGPLNQVLLMTGRVRAQLVWDVVRLLAVVALWLGGALLDVSTIHVTLCFSLLMCFFYAVYIWVTLRTGKNMSS